MQKQIVTVADHFPAVQHDPLGQQAKRKLG